jgi:hypothetical protein
VGAGVDLGPSEGRRTGLATPGIGMPWGMAGGRIVVWGDCAGLLVHHRSYRPTSNPVLPYQGGASLNSGGPGEHHLGLFLLSSQPYRKLSSTRRT